MRSGAYPDGTRVPLVVEVLSPGNRKKAVQLEVDLYRQHGIEAWVVDPKRREIKVFRGQDQLSLFADDDDTLPLPATLGSKTLPLSKVFDLLA
jgi:Uma2 family endonuclease